MLKKQSWISDAVVAVLAVLVAAGFVACGGAVLSTTGSTAGVGEPDDAASMVVLSQVFDDVGMGEQRFADLSLPRTGTLVVTVRWNDQNDDVSAVLTATGCSRVSDHGPVCQVRQSVERQGREGREGRIDYPGASGAYRLLVENGGPSRESIRVTAELMF